MRYALLVLLVACEPKTQNPVILPNVALPAAQDAGPAPPALAPIVRHPSHRAGGGADRDGDGIPDNLDKCPDDPEDYDGFEDDDGCPDPDNDHDGIPDVSDKCPNVPETMNGRQDDDGCPD